MPNHIPETIRDEELTALRERIRSTRRVPDPWGEDPSRGLAGDRLTALLARWGSDFDWRAHERRVRDLPWEVIGTGASALRVIHQRSADAHAPVVVLLHGWPDSVLRFERVLPLLDDVHVVVPALPGFPFSVPSMRPHSCEQIAQLVAEAVAGLGYSRYVVSGGDVGGTVAEIMAASHPDNVSALHLTNLAPARAGMADPAALPDDAVAYLGEVAAWRRTEGGFVAEQSTRPSTLIAALGDSPAGLLAWIGEKLISWSDSAGGRPAFSEEDLLAWISAYWLTGTIGTSLSTYVQPSRLPALITTPTVVSAFAHDIMPAPHGFITAFAPDAEVVQHGDGGHFAAWEQPAAYVADLRRAVGLADVPPRPARARRPPLPERLAG